MFRMKAEPAALVWEPIIPVLDPDPMYGAPDVIWELLPLETGTLWVDFGEKPDANSKYTIRVMGRVDAWRHVARADVEFAKDRQGWPPVVKVNGEPQRFDGLLDIGLNTYPFEREVLIVQTAGRAGTIKVAFLTGVPGPASVSA